MRQEYYWRGVALLTVGTPFKNFGPVTSGELLWIGFRGETPMSVPEIVSEIIAELGRGPDAKKGN